MKYTFSQIIILLISFIFCISCSQNDNLGEWPKQLNLYNIEFRISSILKQETRAEQNSNDNKINNITLLFFNSKGDLIRKEYLDKSMLLENGSSGNSFSCTLTIKENKGDPPTLYAIANARYSDNSDLLENMIVSSSTSTLEKLEDLLVESVNENGLIMSGQTSINESTISIDLKRCVSKLTLQDISGNQLFKLNGFSIHNAADKGYITSGVTKKFYDKYSSLPVGALYDQYEGNYYCYIFPSHTYSKENNTSSLLVIRGSYNDSESYYAIPFCDSNGSYFDLLPNFWYDIKITGVEGIGYESYQEAIENPVNSLIKVDIYDHSPDILSIVSDGVRELGVTPKVEIIDIQNSTEFLVTCFSYLDNSLNEETKKEIYIKPDLEIIEGTDWLEISNMDNPIQRKEDKENRMNYLYSLQIKPINVLSDLQALIRVKWMNLSREIRVIYSNNSSFSNLPNINLRIYSDKTSSYNHLTNYFEWLNGGSVLGIDEGSLKSNQKRNDGLHFPMPHGKFDQNNELIPREYQYELDLSHIPRNDYIDNVSFVLSRDSEPYFNNIFSLEATEIKGVWLLKIEDEEAKRDFSYATGHLIFTVVYDDYVNLPNLTFTVPIYHTGLFYIQMDGKHSMYNYYEVVPMGKNKEGKDFYWLDRNILASSNYMFINYEDDFYGDRNALGYFYKIANQRSGNDIPEISESIICPPGFHVPDIEEWESLITSSNFHNEKIYYGERNDHIPFYQTNHPIIDKIYFPKGGYHLSSTSTSIESYEDSNAGLQTAGYYWTRTPSNGVNSEKTLKVVRFIEGNIDYIDGDITTQRFNLRCVFGPVPDPVKYNSINLNVSGATHVYLYSLQNGVRSPLYSFPGKSVGTQATVDNLSDDEYLHFSTETLINPEDIYVYFLYIDNKGKIQFITSHGDTLSTARGWKYLQGAYYKILWDAQHETYSVEVDEGAVADM